MASFTDEALGYLPPDDTSSYAGEAQSYLGSDLSSDNVTSSYAKEAQEQSAQPPEAPAEKKEKKEVDLNDTGSILRTLATPIVKAAAQYSPEAITSGALEGVRTVAASIDPAAQYLENKFGPMTAGGLLPTAAEASQANQQGLQKYAEGPYATNPWSRAAQLGTEAAIAYRIMAAGGEVLGPVGDYIASKAPAVAPAVNFLKGTTASNAIVNPVTGAVEKASTVGNKLAQYGSKGAQAAEMSVPFTALTSASNPNEPVLQQVGENAAIAGGLGAGAPIVADTLPMIRNYLAGLGISAETKLSQQAQNAIQNLTGAGSKTKLIVDDPVPGVVRPMSEAAAAAGDPNAQAIQRLEMTAAQSNAGGTTLSDPVYAQLQESNAQARRQYAQDLVGTPEDITAIEKQKQALGQSLLGNEAARIANPALPQGAIWQATKPADVSSVLKYIDDAKGGVAKGNANLQSTLGNIQTLLKKDPGAAQDPQYLYESIVKPQIQDKLDAFYSKSPGSQNNLEKSVIPYVKQVKTLLDDAIQKAAPGYAPYKQAYTDLSTQTERLNALQGLKLVNPESPNKVPTPAQVDTALKNVMEGRQNSDPADPFKALTEDDVTKLRNLQTSLHAKAAADKLAGTQGPNTTPQAQFAKKVANEFGTAPNSHGLALGGMIGAAAGGQLEHFIPIGGFGPEVGALAGQKIGSIIANKIASRSGGLANETGKILTQPARYSNFIPPNIAPTSGEIPGWQNLLTSRVNPAIAAAVPGVNALVQGGRNQ